MSISHTPKTNVPDKKSNEYNTKSEYPPTNNFTASVHEITLDLLPSEIQQNLNKIRKTKSRALKDCNTDSTNSISAQKKITSERKSNAKRYMSVPHELTSKIISASNSKSTPLIKKRGLDFTSSTNDHFDGWVFGVPNKFKPKCSSSVASMSWSLKTTLNGQMVNKTKTRQISTSREMTDEQHKGSKPKPNLKAPELVPPCNESFIAGRPRPYIGTCPPNFKEKAKLSKPKQKFFLTQNPRKQYCLRNPEALRVKAYSQKREFNTMAKMVKQADNVCMASASESSESFICDVIDLDNPMELDFQGMDYKNTYELDEQDTKNQQIYRRIARYMERRRVKTEAVKEVENEMQQNRLKVPDRFAVPSRDVESSSTTTVESVHYGKLYRATDKPFNKERIAEEERRRHERYKEMYLRRKEKNEKVRNQREKESKEGQDRLATTLAKEQFNAALAKIDDAIERSFKKERLLRRPEVQRRLFPHSINEAMRFKKELKTQNRIKHETVMIKKEFFKERMNKDKTYPEEELEFSSDKPENDESVIYTSEQSSNDEDKLKVGKTGDVFMLRGFQFKLGEGLRGRNHQNQLIIGDRKEKGCITREQWLAELVPKKEHVKLDVEKGLEKSRDPDDPGLDLFQKQFGFKVPKIEKSTVKQYREKRLGRHYDRILRKNLKIVKPRLRFSVKKFNLISFLYGDDTKRLVQISDAGAHVEMHTKSELDTTLNYLAKKDRDRKNKRLELKQKRLELLGIPCKEVKKSRLQTKCELSESSSGSDWVPEPEPDYNESTQRTTPPLPLRLRGNMPAPRFRDSTLRRHPRRPRNYAAERVPSQIFDEAVRKSGIPHMIKLRDDSLEMANLRIKKRPYTEIFEARHHHDNTKPTQAKKVDVHYQAQVVKPGITKTKTKADLQIMENFHMANPPCNAFVDMNLTLPNYDIDGMISKFAEFGKQKAKQADVERVKDSCRTKNFIFHSEPDRDKEMFSQFPGHQEYLNMLKELHTMLYESTQKNKHDESEKPQLLVDREALVKELEEDLKSIESCLTSLSSSECTNFTNDSGSFLLMEGKTKVPLDYVRKSLVPFEELQRSRFRAVPIDVDAEDEDPYRVMPFPGQKKAQMEVGAAKDTFFTFNTRLKNGIRLRLEVPVEDVRQKLMGRGQHKYYGAVTTDIDENYVDELKHRPPVKLFNRTTCRSMIKDGLRLKFESMLIQGQIVRTKIYDRLNEQHWEQMQKTKLLYEKLFAKWEKKEYDSSMAVVYQVKTYYDITDVLKREYRELEKQLVLLNMDIVYMEGDWIRRLMLQNFHYLLADQDWRNANDWIHRLDDGSNELESYEVSIAKRTQVNIRQRDKDDAWAIKTFYEEQYLKDKHELMNVFPDADSFLKGIENLKSKTFVLLLELHFTLSIHTELQGRLETFEEWCAQDLKERQEYVERKCARKYFISDRANELEKCTLDFLKEPLESSFNDDTFNRDRAFVAEVWRQIVPANIRGTSDINVKPVDMVAMMSDLLFELLAKFETVPVEKRRKVEALTRKRRAYEKKMSKQAFQNEKRIEREMKSIIKNLEPRFQKPKREGRLPRRYIKKRVVKEVEEVKPISEHTKFFIRAFHDDGDISQVTEARESLMVMDTIQEQIVPFYFDHFLKLNGYTPNYNFKTNTELKDGPEIKRLQVREVVPEVLQKLEKWEAARKRVMEENIQRNPKMYENVN